jgi:hypothetical protein
MIGQPFGSAASTVRLTSYEPASLSTGTSASGTITSPVRSNGSAVHSRFRRGRRHRSGTQEIGITIGATSHPDIGDVHVALAAAERGHAVLTSDDADIAAVDPKLVIVHV